MFDATLDKYTGSNYKIELKEDAKPYYAKPFSISKIHEPDLTKEVNTSIKIGRKLIIPNGQLLLLLYLRQMYGTARFISDFRELN